jgi:glycine oxidase
MFPRLADELLFETAIDIELDRTGTLYLAFTDEEVKILDERLRWQQGAKLPVEHLSAEAALRLEPGVSRSVKEALLFPNDWQVENRKLLVALRRYAETNGIHIIENCGVKSLVVENGRITGAETDDGFIAAGTCVLTTGAWTSLITVGNTDLAIKVEPVRGQIVAFGAGEKPVDHVVYSRRGYIVPRRDNRILAGSTTEFVGFDKSVTSSALQTLIEVATEISPRMAAFEIIDQWSGLRPHASDGMPVVGQMRGLDNLTIATAHYRNGILLAPITAEIVAGRVASDVDHDVFTAFGPERFRSAASAG